MITSAMRGLFLSDPRTRNEFMLSHRPALIPYGLCRSAPVPLLVHRWERGIGYGADSPPRFTLDRIGALLHILDNPHQRFASVHIAGSKGKGSTAAILESVLRAAGSRTGLYTQPHLHTFRERVRIDNRPIGPEMFAAWWSGLPARWILLVPSTQI